MDKDISSNQSEDNERPTTFGQLIKSKRIDHGLSYGQVAQLVGTTKSSVYDWEQDRSAPKTKSLAALSCVLELTVSELRALGVDVVNDAPSLPAMLRADYDLPPAAITQVERYVAHLARRHGSHQASSSSNEERRD